MTALVTHLISALSKLHRAIDPYAGAFDGRRR